MPSINQGARARLPMRSFWPSAFCPCTTIEKLYSGVERVVRHKAPIPNPRFDTAPKLVAFESTRSFVVLQLPVSKPDDSDLKAAACVCGRLRLDRSSAP